MLQYTRDIDSQVIQSTGASDVLFYVAGAAAAAAAGAAPLTRAARLPLLGLFGGSLFAERCLPPRLHSLLRVGDKGQVPSLGFWPVFVVEVGVHDLYTA